MNNKEWLNSTPLKEEIKIKNGGKYIPYRIIVDKLNKLCGDDWSVKNFRETYVNLPKGRVLITGNVEVDVCYFDADNKRICRTLAGAANFMLTKQCNVHYSATVKSLAIMNAVKVLGTTFGLDINSENESEDEAVNQMPIIREEKQVVDKVRERHILMMQDCTTLEDVKGFELLSKTHKFTKEYNTKLKELENGN